MVSVTTPTDRAGEGANNLLERLLECIESRVADDRIDALRPFARAYARRLDADDAVDPEEFCFEVIGAFELADRRGAEPLIVRAFTPSLATDGYETPGSVVETNSVDSPFLVDSVTLAIEQAGHELHDVIHPIVGVERDEGGRDRGRSSRARERGARVDHALRAGSTARAR